MKVIDVVDQAKFANVSEIEIPQIFYNRLKTGVEDFDVVFGEGILPGSSTTLTAQAGCGKTTFMLQLLEYLNIAGYNCAYASGEENIYQLAFTCNRLDVKSVSVANITDIDELCDAMEEYDVMVIDSFQALTTKTKMNSREIEKYAISQLVQRAKETETAIFFIMHITKMGQLKGSTLVPHSVDVNIMITHDVDSEDERSRIISTYKNRFGACLDVGADLGAKGFTVSGKIDVAVAKGSAKKDRKADLKKGILNMDPPNITEQMVMNTYSLTRSQTYLVLRDLVAEGKLVKLGRGQSAVWKKVLEVSVV